MILIIVAHPDDESLWFGGGLQRLKDRGVSLGIISLTCRSHEVRAKEFSVACERLGAQSLMLDYTPHGNLRFDDFSGEMEREMKKVEWDPLDIQLIITHSPDGDERHHWQHIDCFHWSREWSKKRGIPFSVFSWSPPEDRWASYRIERKIGTDILYRRHLFSWKTFVRTIRIIRDELKAYGWRVAQYRFRQYRKQSLVFNEALDVLKLSIDLGKKQELVQSYQSQLSGVSQYSVFKKENEYIYFFSRSARGRFLKSLGLE